MSSIPKIYLEKGSIKDTEIIIDNENYHHLKNVLRLNIGDKITVCDNNKNDYLCEIISCNSFIVAKILENKISEAEFNFSVSLFQGFAKGDKMETIIQKSTELGVTDIYPVIMNRCVSKPDDKSMVNKIKRYHKIAESAAAQSGRGIIPVVHNAITYNDAIKKLKLMDIGFVCYEGKDTVPLKSLIESVNDINSIGFIIGPEGGISDTECSIAEENNIDLVGLGKRILRTETASSFVLSVLSVFFS